MPVNRFSQQLWQAPASKPVAVMAPQNFVVCSGFMVSGSAAPSWTWHQEIFRIAYEAARANNAAAFRSETERLFSCWN